MADNAIPVAAIDEPESFEIKLGTHVLTGVLPHPSSFLFIAAYRDEERGTAEMLNLLEGLLDPDSYRLLKRLVIDPRSGVTDDHVAAVIQKVIELSSGRPTGSPSDS